jgi:hypothetical protein
MQLSPPCVASFFFVEAAACSGRIINLPLGRAKMVGLDSARPSF